MQFGHNRTNIIYFFYLFSDFQHSAADLVFILDVSGSIGDKNFGEVHKLVTSIVEKLIIGPDAWQVAVICFDNSASIEIPLTDHKNQETLVTAIKEIKYTQGGTNTAEALKCLLHDGYKKA